MRYLIKKLIHFFTATNQHGIHSPFVYNYVTKCLYSNQKFAKKKSIDIFFRSIAYFKVETLSLPSDTKALKQIMLEKFPALQLGTTPYDMIHTNACDLKKTEGLGLDTKKIHNDTMLFVTNIHQTKTTEHAWQQLKHNEKVTVTLDLFHCGIIFFRKEQAKEHFKIRI